MAILLFLFLPHTCNNCFCFFGHRVTVETSFKHKPFKFIWLLCQQKVAYLHMQQTCNSIIHVEQLFCPAGKFQANVRSSFSSIFGLHQFWKNKFGLLAAKCSTVFTTQMLTNFVFVRQHEVKPRQGVEKCYNGSQSSGGTVT